jgi:hypothetical protein
LKGHDSSRATNAHKPVRALQAAKKLIQTAVFNGFVTEPDFSRANKANQINVGL